MRHIPIIATLAALLGLLAYSLERTVWLFRRFEVAAEPAWAAAIVVELAAVALIISAGALPEHARPWGNRALLAVLSVQALANLSAGYLRGGRATLGLFGTADDPSAYAVASVLWLVTNLAIPGLTLSLSKLLEHLIIAARAVLPACLDAFEEAIPDVAPAEIATGPHSAPVLDWQVLPLKQLSTEPPARLELLAEVFEPQALPSTTSTDVLDAPEPERYICPHCSAVLSSKQARGAAVKHGHCPACKETR